jgi:hypothetical protein
MTEDNRLRPISILNFPWFSKAEIAEGAAEEEQLAEVIHAMETLEEAQFKEVFDALLAPDASEEKMNQAHRLIHGLMQKKNFGKQRRLRVNALLDRAHEDGSVRGWLISDGIYKVIFASSDPSHNEDTLLYLSELESSLMFGKCAGKTTQLDKLFQNRIFYSKRPEMYLYEITKLISELDEKNPTKEDEPLRAIENFLKKSKHYQIFADQKENEREYSVELKNYILTAKDSLWSDLQDVLELPSAYEFNLKSLTQAPECQLINEMFVDEDFREVSIIFGEPGYGKSVFLQQLALKIIEESLQFDAQENYKPVIPIFTSARNLVNSMRDFDGPDNRLRTPENPEELFQLLCEASCRSSQYVEYHHLDSILEFDITGRLNHRFEYILMIDAYDECDSSEREHIAKFILDDCEDHEINVIMTSRNHLRNEMLENKLLYNNSASHRQLWMEFTAQELEYEMPMKLANAWGLDHDLILDKSAGVFDDYREILTHPLFVGFFCMLLEKGELNSTKKSTPSSSISIGETKLIHVQFIQKVIKHGLEITISERHDIENFDLDEISNIFHHMALLESLNRRPSTFYELRRDLRRFKIEFDDKVAKIIKENLGVMYSGGADDNQLVWTHKTIREVAAAQLVATWGKRGSWEASLSRRFGNRGLPEELLSVAFALTYMNETIADNKHRDMELDLLPKMAAIFNEIPLDFIDQLEYIEYPLIKYNTKTRKGTHTKDKLTILSRPGTASHALAQEVVAGFSCGVMPYDLPEKAFHLERNMHQFLFEASRFATNHGGKFAIKLHRYPMYIRNPPLGWLLSDDRRHGDFDLFMSLWHQAENIFYEELDYCDDESIVPDFLYHPEDWEEFQSRIEAFDATPLRRWTNNYTRGVSTRRILSWFDKLITLVGPNAGDDGYNDEMHWQGYESLTQELVAKPATKLLSTLNLHQVNRVQPLNGEEINQLVKLLSCRFGMEGSTARIFQIPQLERRGLNWFIRLVCATRWYHISKRSTNLNRVFQIPGDPIWDFEIDVLTKEYGEAGPDMYRCSADELERMRNHIAPETNTASDQPLD